MATSDQPYLNDLRDALVIAAEVAEEVTSTMAAEMEGLARLVGAAEVERLALAHIHDETERRFQAARLERKRAGLR